jgi:competence protein ComEC
MAFQFGRISLVSLIANPFILPVQPMLMVLAGIALLLSFLYLPLGQITAWIAWPFAAYTNRMVEFFNGMPHGIVILGNFSFLFVVSFYIILFLITFAGKRLKQILRVTLAPSAITLIIGVAVYLVWTAIFHVPDGNLHLTFLDVGSADAILIQTPTGRFILVDGGSSPSKLASDLGRRLSILDRSIDWMVIASPQEQQVAALPRILDRFPVENVLWSGNLYASYSARELNRWLINHQVPITHASAGFSLDLGEGARLEVCSVSTRGALLLVSWQGFRALLPIGINFDDIEYMDQGKKIGSVTALLLADSGYAPVNPSEWLTNLHPWLIILDVAAGDPDGLPDPLVIDRLAGITLLRTDQNGWINLSTDSNGMWVEVEKK